jgi:hypothetical protein
MAGVRVATHPLPHLDLCAERLAGTDATVRSREERFGLDLIGLLLENIELNPVHSTATVRAKRRRAEIEVDRLEHIGQLADSGQRDKLFSPPLLLRTLNAHERPDGLLLHLVIRQREVYLDVADSNAAR